MFASCLFKFMRWYMKSVGIICEYNPFHNGHLYHIKKIKELYPDYVIIAVMSGNFTQRGDFSLIDKWGKTEVALNYVDLVIELPFVFATQAADIFTKASSDILNELKVDAFVFGSESADINKLKEIVEVQKKEEYNLKIKNYLDKGFNYPTSLAKALKDFGIILKNNPNDLLGIGYIRNLRNVQVTAIKRTNDYHSLELKNISSATGIREALKKGINIKKYVPDKSYECLKDLHFWDDYFDLLKYKILSSDDLSIYQTVDEGIENKIRKNILKAHNIDELIKLVKSKRYTYNKLKRMFLHILCSFTKEEAKRCLELQYIRVLGFNDQGRKYLNSIKKECKLPIVSNYDNSFEIMQIENRVCNIYNIKKDDFIEEYKHKPIIF